ncbi:MAG TPA: ATP-binding protein [Chloroflexota bacterium]|nr:ATP-binding protein [Chloroflexota bacterium]
MRLRYKLPIAFALTTLVFAGIVGLAAAVLLRGVYLDRLENDMSLQARQFASVLEQEAAASVAQDPAYLESLTNQAGDAANLRLTLIAHDGTVLGDSEVDPKALGNHSDRPEVRQALAGHEGRARRESATLKQQEVYVAVPLPASSASWSSGVVRTALPASRVDSMVSSSWRIPLVVWAILLVPTLVVSYLLARSITRPVYRMREMTGHVAAGELAYRTGIRRNDELGELATSLNDMASELETHVDQLAAEKERSAQVLTAMTEGVIVVDAEGRVVRANPAASRILQVPLEDFEGSSLVVAVRAFPGRLLAEKAQRAGVPISEIIELPGQRLVHAEVIPLHTGTGTGGVSGHALFVIRDETARLTLDRTRRDFVSNVSHELKTPLASLSLLASTLKRAMRNDPDQAGVFLDRLSSEVGRLTDLTDDLLVLSELEEEGTELEREFTPVDVGVLARETVAELLPMAERKEQEVVVESEPDAMVLGDEVTLHTLVRNLLDNAIRYTEPRGHIAVRVWIESDEAGGGRWVVLTVKDDGVGIPAAEQGRIFERFYRVDKGRSRETGGTGLGLSIVRHVAQRHGGAVDVVSTLGSGSTFRVRIPAAG